MIISMIAAMANNRVIGADNKMPWHLPADLKHFKQVTLGHPVVMGRKTYQSIGKALPGRLNVVITHDSAFNPDDVTVVGSPEAAITLLKDQREVMIIGGGSIYQYFLPDCHRLYLTHIDLEVEGDTCFPDYESAANWQQVDQQQCMADDKNPHNYQFVTLEKVV